MVNTVSKINLSKIGWEGGRPTSIWIMSLNILCFFLEITPKPNILNKIYQTKSTKLNLSTKMIEM